jgi:phage terminase large subunit-like protein
MKVDTDALAGLSDEELYNTLLALAEHKKFNLLDFVNPYPKQMEFFALGSTKQERMLFAGNQMGKSYAGAIETAYHLTGLYPAGWLGRRWGRPVKGWAAGESTTVTRDVAQTLLCGEPGLEAAFGTGLIPKHCFADKPTLARGAVADAYDTVQVFHHTDGVVDGVSTLQYKSYEQGRKKFQGRTLDFVWWDEEPPMDVYVEGNARWSATGGMSFMTFTPLQGMSSVVCRFLSPERDEKPEAVAMRGHLTMGIKDALHMTPEMIESLLAKYPKHEHAARMNGEPLLGSGRVFVYDESTIVFDRGKHIPVEWAKLWGVDFGIEHPFAAVLIAWDRDLDIVYVVNTYKLAGATPLVHSEAIRAIAANVPVAWPHDGQKREENKTGEFAPMFKKFNLNMLPEHATYPGGGFSTEAAVLEMQQRLEKGSGPGGLMICEDLEELLAEMRGYHRKDGLLVKIRDDLISALQKALMMKRYARAMALGTAPRRNRLPGERPQAARPIDPWTGQPVGPEPNQRPYGDHRENWQPTFRY